MSDLSNYFGNLFAHKLIFIKFSANIFFFINILKTIIKMLDKKFEEIFTIYYKSVLITIFKNLCVIKKYCDF